MYVFDKPEPTMLSVLPITYSLPKMYTHYSYFIPKLSPIILILCFKTLVRQPTVI